MAAPPLEQVGARAEPAVQVERRDRPARSLPVAVAARDQHDGAVEALDEPRGDDADHALVPVGAGDDVRAPAAVGLGPLLHRRDRLAQDATLDRLPLLVQLLQRAREVARLFGVAGQ